MVKGGILEHQKNMISKILVNTIDFSFPLEFSKLCLIIEAKVITLLKGVLSICRGNTKIL